MSRAGDAVRGTVRACRAPSPAGAFTPIVPSKAGETVVLDGNHLTV
jgi:hypothetical protein